ncbi:MAG: hypothetical protein R3264_16315 [Anaerolineae bacterium]|nr:hypothetical protein [Anaerolineae bacterium]
MVPCTAPFSSRWPDAESDLIDGDPDRFGMTQVVVGKTRISIIAILLKLWSREFFFGIKIAADRKGARSALPARVVDRFVAIVIPNNGWQHLLPIAEAAKIEPVAILNTTWVFWNLLGSAPARFDWSSGPLRENGAVRGTPGGWHHL